MNPYPAELHRLASLGLSADEETKFKGPIRLDARGRIQALDAYLTFVDDSEGGDLVYESETSWPTIAAAGKYFARDYAPYAKGDLITEAAIADLTSRAEPVDDVWIEFFVIRRGARQFADYVHNINLAHLTRWHPVLDALEAIPSKVSGRKGTYEQPAAQMSAANIINIFAACDSFPNDFFPLEHFSPSPVYVELYRGKEVGGAPCLATDLLADIALLQLTEGDPTEPGWNNPETHDEWKALVASENSLAAGVIFAIDGFAALMAAEGLAAQYGPLLAALAAVRQPAVDLLARNAADALLEPGWTADYIPVGGGMPQTGYGDAERAARVVFLQGLIAAGLNPGFGPSLPQLDVLYANRWYWFERCAHLYFGSRAVYKDFDYISFVREERASYTHLNDYIVSKFGVGE